MNILILTNKFPFPPRDGGSIATLHMLLGLHQAGNRVTCLAMNTTKHPFALEKLPEDLRKSIRFLAVEANTSIRPLRLLINLLFSNEPYIARRFYQRSFRLALQALLGKESFDIIQMEGSYLSCYLRQIRDESEALVSLRAHNVEHVIWTRLSKGKATPLRRWYMGNLARRLQAFERQMAHQVDCLIPISQQDESLFRASGTATPMLTIPAGLNLEDYPFTPLPDTPTLFFIGALDWLPNQEGLSWFLDHVFERLLKEIPDARLHVAGRNAPSRFLKRLDRPGITWHGEVDDAPGFMRSYRIMLAPLFSGSGIRIKILEAMALGRPVVTTRTGMEGIPADSLTTVLVADDPADYKDLVIKLLKNPNEQDLGFQEARSLISREFDTFILSKRLSQFYKEKA